MDLGAAEHDNEIYMRGLHDGRAERPDAAAPIESAYKAFCSFMDLEVADQEAVIQQLAPTLTEQRLARLRNMLYPLGVGPPPPPLDAAQPDECARCGAAVCRGAKIRAICEDCLPVGPVKYWKDGTAHPEDEVLCTLSNPSLVLHHKHKDCPQESPHQWDECGVVHPPEDAPEGPWKAEKEKGADNWAVWLRGAITLTIEFRGTEAQCIGVRDVLNRLKGDKADG